MIEPHISENDSVELERICDRVLSGDTDAPDELTRWMNRTTQKLGGEQAGHHWFVHNSHNDLGLVRSRKFQESILKTMPPGDRKEFEGIVKVALVEMLQQHGFTLGVDFSMAADGGLILGELASQAIKVDLPNGIWSEI
jgi:hypothetical protein